MIAREKEGERCTSRVGEHSDNAPERICRRGKTDCGKQREGDHEEANQPKKKRLVRNAQWLRREMRAHPHIARYQANEQDSENCLLMLAVWACLQTSNKGPCTF